MANRNRKLVSYQTPATVEGPEIQEGEQATSSSKVGNFDFGELHKGTFRIKVVDDDEKEIYSNKEEPFEYERVDLGLSTLLNHLGAELSAGQKEMLDKEFPASEDKENKLGKAILSLTNIVRAKDKADAKQARYAAITNQYKPLVGEKKESAIASTIYNLTKVMGVSAEVVIEMLKTNKAVEDTYTVEEYNRTPRRAKGSKSAAEDED